MDPTGTSKVQIYVEMHKLSSMTPNHSMTMCRGYMHAAEPHAKLENGKFWCTFTHTPVKDVRPQH